MIVEVRPAAFAFPVVIQDWFVGIKYIPAMRPEPHRQSYLFTEKVQERVVSNFRDNSGRGEQKAGGTEHAGNRGGGCLFDWDRAPLHCQDSVTLEFSSAHGEHVASLLFIWR